MAVIGTFKLAKNGGWEGNIRTLCFEQKIGLIPNDDQVNKNAPAFRVMLGWQRIGEAWEEKTDGKTPRDYLSVRIDDLSFAAPLRAGLFPDDDGTSARLVRIRQQTAHS